MPVENISLFLKKKELPRVSAVEIVRSLCPQELPIPELLEKVARAFEE